MRPFPMDDKEAIAIFTQMLTKYPLTKEEQEAVRHTIGLLGWTKLLEGYHENRKKARDRKLQDL